MLPGIAAGLTGLATGAGAGLASAAGQAIASAVDPAARAYRKQLKKDISAMQQGKLGLSEAEKRSMLAGTQRALQAQTAGTEAMLRRSAAAQGGFGRSGAQQKALGQVGAEQREELARQAGKIDELSQAKAQERFASIMGRIQDKRREAREMGAQIATGALTGAVTGAAAYPTLKADWQTKQLQDAEAAAQLKKMQELEEYRKALEAPAQK